MRPRGCGVERVGSHCGVCIFAENAGDCGVGAHAFLDGDRDCMCANRSRCSSAVGIPARLDLHRSGILHSPRVIPVFIQKNAR